MLLPEWVGTLIFLTAVGLTGAKINKDFGDHGLFGYIMLLVMIAIYSAAVGVAYA